MKSQCAFMSPSVDNLRYVTDKNGLTPSAGQYLIFHWTIYCIMDILGYRNTYRISIFIVFIVLMYIIMLTL